MTLKGARPIYLSILLVAILYSSRGFAGEALAQGQNAEPVQIAIKNVMYHYSAPIAVHIAQAQGELLPTKPGGAVIFDDKSSFVLSLNYAEASITCNSLARVLNENVFSAANAAIKNLTIENKNNQLIITGKLHEKGDLGFETTGTLIVESDGRIRLHTEHFKAAHLSLKGLFDALGMDVARAIDAKKIPGVSTDKDDLILNPTEMLPLPSIKGQVTAVRLQDNEIVLIFGAPQPENFAAKQPGNYIALRHGSVQFGKLAMRNSDVIMIDADPRDPFDFFLDRYQDQLIAGYSKSTPEFGVRAYVPDYNKIRTHAAGRAKKGRGK